MIADKVSSPEYKQHQKLLRVIEIQLTPSVSRKPISTPSSGSSFSNEDESMETHRQ